MNHTIRTGTLKDLETIAAFNSAMAEETEGMSLQKHIIVPGVEAVLNDPLKGFYLLAEDEGRIIGQLMITFEWSDWRNGNIWWIQSVYVQPEARRKGVYKSLYEEVCRMALKSKVTGLRLYVDEFNDDAQKVYSSLGMRESHYVMYEAILPQQVSDR